MITEKNILDAIEIAKQGGTLKRGYNQASWCGTACCVLGHARLLAGHPEINYGPLEREIENTPKANKLRDLMYCPKKDILKIMEQVNDKGQIFFPNADLRNANLWNANLWNADLRNANLWNADLRNANLWNADLRKADLRNANLQGADLRNANLQGADLRNADLWNANLQDADLQNANLQDADLQDADLRGAIQ